MVHGIFGRYHPSDPCMESLHISKICQRDRELFNRKIEQDTNTPICISSRDATLNHLAATLNEQLSKLREKEHCFVQGDLELKNAITNIFHDLRTPLTAIC